MAELAGKVALITGAGQGVGLGIAMALSSEGVRVVLAGRTLEKVEAAAEQVRARGGEAVAVACNVRPGAGLTAAGGPGARPFWGGAGRGAVMGRANRFLAPKVNRAYLPPPPPLSYH